LQDFFYAYLGKQTVKDPVLVGDRAGSSPVTRSKAVTYVAAFLIL